MGFSRPMSRSSKVVLPAPEGPTSPTDSPLLIVQSTDTSAGRRLPGYLKLR